jgi:cation/acetate symporter
MARLLPPERDIGVLNAPVRACFGLSGAFLVVILSLGLLERLGLASGAALTGVIGAAIALFGFAALLSHSRRAPDFYVADRKISGAFGGLAGAAAFAGLLALGLCGGSYASRGAFLSATVAIVAGYLALALFIAPRLRGLGAYTPGDVLAARLGGSWVRVAWAAVAFSASTLLLIGVLKILGPLLASLLGFREDHAFYVAAALLALATFPGGMRSLTWTQAVQYFVIALACLLTAAFVFEREPAADVAMIEYLDAIRLALPSAGGTSSIGLALSLLLTAIGTASLPHLLMRVLAMRPFGKNGAAMIWTAFFSAIVLLTGLVLADLLAVGLSASAGGDPIGALVAHLSGLPAVLIGVVFAGVLAALLALGQAVLFASASALSHDMWDEIVDRSGAEGRRIVVARIITVAVAWTAATIAESWSLPVPILVEWAFALAAAGAFAPLLLGLWWSRCTDIGALAGMLSGFGLAGTMFLMAQGVVRAALVSEGWVGLGAPAAAAAGMALALILTIGVSLITPAPRAERDRARGGTPIRERPA